MSANDKPQQPWPRYLMNFPIIMIAIAQEYFWAGALIWDYDTAVNVTTVSVLAKYMMAKQLIVVLIFAGTMAAAGFYMRRRFNNLLALVPQQFILYLSAGGALEAIYNGQFADGVIRSQAFLLADQCSSFLIAIFHTWAMMLILKYGED